MINYRLYVNGGRNADRLAALKIDWSKYSKDMMAAVLEVAILDHEYDCDGMTHDYQWELDFLAKKLYELDDLVK